MLTRRTFLELASAAGLPVRSVASTPPWYRIAMRWGQTNITERDPTRYDIAWWHQYWRDTFIQGVIINAGGIVAYYPSKFPLQHRAEFLGGRDLYGELVNAARQEKLAIIARMDSNRASEDFFSAHPRWFARNAAGDPFRSSEKYIACINSGYYREYLPEVLQEIIARSHPDGFADNSWSGLGRSHICYCENCARQFKDKYRRSLPAAKDWDDAAYRDWIGWSYQTRLDLWDLNNKVTRSAGGPDCLWLGMNSGSITSQSASFRDMQQLCQRSEIMLLDHQSRTETTGFSQNADAGALVHGLLGWDKFLPESMALYQAPSRDGDVSFRLASKPPLEARMWMFAGFAGGIQPWWHHVGAYHEDRRMYRTARPVFEWHKTHERWLTGRTPIAPVGIVWSQRNTDFFGRDQAASLVDLPARGMTEALMRARIPYLPVHVDEILREPDIRVLILPNLGALSNTQCASVSEFVARGGALLATGVTSAYDEWGDPRSDFGLARLFGAHLRSPFPRGERLPFAASTQSYLRLLPERRGLVPGPHTPDEPASPAPRHRVLRGFDDTDIVPFGAALAALEIDASSTVPLTYVPPFPAFPPETAWMRQPVTNIPGLILRTHENSRIAYLPAPLDSCYGQLHLDDHAVLLANVVTWLLAERSPLRVAGPGLLDCRLYRQKAALILHLLNLSNEAAWKAPFSEVIPVGPLHVELELPTGISGRGARSLTSSMKLEHVRSGRSLNIVIPSVRDHEVIVVT